MTEYKAKTDDNASSFATLGLDGSVYTPAQLRQSYEDAAAHAASEAEAADYYEAYKNIAGSESYYFDDRTEREKEQDRRANERSRAIHLAEQALEDPKSDFKQSAKAERLYHLSQNLNRFRYRVPISLIFFFIAYLFWMNGTTGDDYGTLSGGLGILLGIPIFVILGLINLTPFSILSPFERHFESAYKTQLFHEWKEYREARGLLVTW